jgi:hypothetical protein
MRNDRRQDLSLPVLLSQRRARLELQLGPTEFQLLIDCGVLKTVPVGKHDRVTRKSIREYVEQYG